MILLVAVLLTQTPALDEARASNQKSYEAALDGFLAKRKLKRVPMELVSDANTLKPGFKNVKIGAWHSPQPDSIVPLGPALVTDAKGVVHLAWPDPQSVKTVVIEVTAPPAEGMPEPMREIRALVPEQLSFEKKGSDLSVTFKATTLERRLRK